MHKWSGGWVSNIQVLDRQAMRLNGCFPKNTIYIHTCSSIQYLEPDKEQSNLEIVCLEGRVADREAGLTC